MRRLQAVDRLLLAALVPLWLLAITLHVREILRTGSAQVPVFAAPGGADGVPTVGGFRLERDSRGTGLEVGDRLLRIGDADLRGAGYFGFDAIAFHEAGTSLRAELVYERAGERRETVLALRPSEAPWSRMPFIASFGLIAILVMLRARPSRATRYFFVGFLGFAIFEAPFEGGPPAQTYASYTVFYTLGPISFYALLRWLILFPDELAPAKRPSAAWSAIAAVFLLARASYVFGGPFTGAWAPRVAILGDLVFMVVCLAILTHNTLESGPIGRRRVKWVLYGAYLSTVPLLLNLVAPFAGFDFARFDQLLNVSLVMSWMLPAGLAIAVLRYRLFDIDRLISTTVTASALVAVLVGAIATVVPMLSRALGAILGLDVETGQTVLSAALAAGAVPTHQWLRPQVDRLFFVDRHALERGIAELLPALGACKDARALAGRLGDGLDRLVDPEVCVIYARDGDQFAPAFTSGPAVPPVFEAQGPLLQILRDRSAPLALPRGRRAKGPAAFGPFERAALETLGAEAVVPIRRGSELVAFLCLGAKSSGDVYTPTDLSLLLAVAEKVSAELLRFDQEQVIRDGQAMQEALRRYVPGAVAEELATGGELASGERPVSVLFVDIRGYTSFSEAREAAEVFSTINRYTARVSTIARRHGGSVVEFNGDGMMVVFGAPQELPERERAAVDAGREIVASMDAPTAAGGSGAEEQLAVGVGIASGVAFVGNIRAADRMIWSAIGDCVNLAARLEALTRDLDAAIVIDDATWSRASEAGKDFTRHEGVPIRGRSELLDLHVLPLARSAGAVHAASV